MKKTTFFNYIGFIVLLLIATACSKTEKQTEQLPQKKQESNKMELMLSNSQIKLANVKSIKLGNGKYANAIELKAQLNTNAEGINIISSRFSGRVEKLFIKEIGRPINKGQLLFKIYSEDLLALQNDFLLNLKQQESFPNEAIYKQLTEAAKHKLALFGYSPVQTKQLEKTKKTDAYISVFAETAGIVKEINILEGSYITEGMTLFRLEDLSDLWVEAEVYPNEIEHIKTGQNVKIIIAGYEDEPISSTISFIMPQFNDNEQTITVRAKINNSSLDFQSGMFAKMIVSTSQKTDILKVPINAIIRNEKYNHVWIRTSEHTFEPRKIVIDTENENFAIIKSGINNGDEVVTSGTYLLYSEYKLKKGNLQF